MPRPSRFGFTGRPDYEPTAKERAVDLARSVRDDTAMAAAAARDYPVATSTLVLAVGGLALLGGYLIGSTYAQERR